MNAPPSLPTSSRYLVGGKYRLGERLGEGAFGAVYRAIHAGEEKPFAIRLLAPSSSPGFAERFGSMGAALELFRHPHVAEVTDSGLDGMAGGLPYIVTELVAGRPLSEAFRDRSQLPPARALALLGQIAAALDAAHEAGIVHGDLRPGNVFVSENPDSLLVKVLDFGLAALAGSDENLSLTPLYMAPEILRHEPAIPSSDVYSFGVLAYEILEGRPPFQGTQEEVQAGHLKAEPPVPTSLPPQVWLSLRRALRKDPAHRPRTAGEVVRQCQRGMAEAEQAGWRPPVLPPAPAAPKPAVPAPPQSGPPARPRRPPQPGPRRNLLLAAAALACLALVGFLGFLFGRMPEEKSGGVETRSLAERQPPAVPLQEPERQPDPPPTSIATAPDLPNMTLGFDDIEEVCGHLSSVSTYICLVRQGPRDPAGGERFIFGEDRAEFKSNVIYPSGVSISIEGKEYIRLAFSAPKGKGFIPGLYTGAVNPSKGPYPGIAVVLDSLSCSSNEEGRFYVYQVQVEGTKVRQFVADFESSCRNVIGRIALGYEGGLLSRPPLGPAIADEAPTSPGGLLGFNDIDRACGDLAALPSYLCLLNRGNEPIAGGTRRVIDGNQALFKGVYHKIPNGDKVTIDAEGEDRYSFTFGSPPGRWLAPGLYPGAKGPFSRGPHAEIYSAIGSSGFNESEGQFRITRLEVSGRNVLRFVADFEISNGLLGRVAMTQQIQVQPRAQPPKATRVAAVVAAAASPVLLSSE